MYYSSLSPSQIYFGLNEKFENDIYKRHACGQGPQIANHTNNHVISLVISVFNSSPQTSLLSPQSLIFLFFYFGQTPIPYLSLHILYLSQYYPTTISLHSAKPTQKHPISSSDQKEKKSPQYCPNNSTLCRAPPLPQRPPWCNTGSSS